MALSVGDKAPSFSLPATGGEPITLNDLEGRKVALYFYPRDDTSGCTLQAQQFQALKAQFSAADTEIIGVSADSVKSHDKFRRKHALDFPLASDEGKKVLQAYGVWVEKSMYGRRFMGIERTTVLIDRDGTIAGIWSKVKVPGHAEDVLEAAKAL
jgi:thioredoxin-dependent peroxiredoxin